MNALKIAFYGLITALLLATAYYIDLVICAIAEPGIEKVLPCYQNAIGKLAVKTIEKNYNQNIGRR